MWWIALLQWIAFTAAQEQTDCAKFAEEEQRKEMPMLNLQKYDHSLLMVCEDIISPDEIYTSLMAVMVRVEDALRSKRCDPLMFGLHEKPIKVQTLFGQLKRTKVEDMRKHPVLGTYIDTMIALSDKIVAYADKCYYDHRLMMKLTRMSMKLLVNKLTCTELKLDIAKNRLGWPSKWVADDRVAKADPGKGAGLGAVGGAVPAAKDPNDPGRIPYTRWSGAFAGDPDQWPWNGWPWRSNVDPPAKLREQDRGTQGQQPAGNVIPAAPDTKQ